MTESHLLHPSFPGIPVRLNIPLELYMKNLVLSFHRIFCLINTYWPLFALLLRHIGNPRGHTFLQHHTSESNVWPFY